MSEKQNTNAGPSLANVQSTKAQRMQPKVAFKALRTLINNPEDTRQVFTIIRAMSGSSLQRGFARFSRTELGQQKLNAPRPLLAVLEDRASLAELPANSLGKAYLRFVQKQQISAGGLVDASTDDMEVIDPDLQCYAERLRDMHDLWHVSTQYGRDTLGEVCLLGFTYAQTRNRGLGIIALVGAYKESQRYGFGVWRALRRAYRAGRRAAWLPGADWETLLALPLDEVRAKFAIEEPVAYYQTFAQEQTA